MERKLGSALLSFHLSLLLTSDGAVDEYAILRGIETNSGDTNG